MKVPEPAPLVEPVIPLQLKVPPLLQLLVAVFSAYIAEPPLAEFVAQRPNP
jgi:hypothetical protein